jgi:hypothetical protein
VFPQASDVPVQGEFANLDPNADGCLDAAQHARGVPLDGANLFEQAADAQRPVGVLKHLPLMGCF